ncbi:hypothetical protein TheetDRAFT_2443 [Thermoanaerobacter ethanolicus JW 200]|nr:hypothetical protein TheetDRAFT_2443 [Thermoanaerobacter ethanolicus JW 200]
MTYIPSKLICDANFDIEIVNKGLFISLVWVLILGFIVFLLMKNGLKKYTSHGAFALIVTTSVSLCNPAYPTPKIKRNIGHLCRIETFKYVKIVYPPLNFKTHILFSSKFSFLLILFPILYKIKKTILTRFKSGFDVKKWICA